MSLSTKFLAHRKPKFQLRSFDNLNRTFPDDLRRLVKRLVAGEGRGRTWREIQRAPVRDSGGRGGERVCGSERAPCDGTTLIAICKKLCSEISTKLTPKMYFFTRNTNPSRKLCSRWRLFEQFSIFAKIFGKNGISSAVREISP